MDYKKSYRICFPEKKVFISRNHNWAFSAWEIGRLRRYIQPKAVIVHIDNHLDYLYPQLEVGVISNENEAIATGSRLKIDEFVLAGLETGTLEKVLMISNDAVDISDESTVSRAYTLNHYEHAYKKDWIRMTENKSVILDLDLDFFNYNYRDYDTNGILPTEEIIRSQMGYIKNMMEWDMITVALSPEFCGGNDKCSCLFELFLEVFDLDIGNAEVW